MIGIVSNVKILKKFEKSKIFLIGQLGINMITFGGYRGNEISKIKSYTLTNYLEILKIHKNRYQIPLKSIQISQKSLLL